MKIIPVRQAGVLNFLGRQKMVTVPIRWKSGEGDEHPETELAYITKPEKEKLIKLDMHGSMKDGKPNFGPAGLISLNSGGDGGAGGGGGGGGGGDGGTDASSPGDTGGAGGADGAGGNDASGGSSSGGGSTDSGDQGSEAANNAATNSANASVGASDNSSPTDTGDMGSEAANVSSTQSGAASVGAVDSFGGYNPSRGFGVVDTGDLGSLAANNAATQSGAAAVGQGTFSPYGVVGFNKQSISNYMKGNPGTTLGLNAISLMTGIPGLALANAINSIYGSPGTNSGNTGTSGDGGDTYNASQISQILTTVFNQYKGPSAAKNFAQKYPSSSQSGTLSFQSAYDTAKQNLGSLLTAPMSPYGNNAVSASPFYDYLKKNNLDRGIL
jgi:hypothetical protein